ncbi:hypothetical protein SRHO_G00012540 [Serrasalmus rhombeus]
MADGIPAPSHQLCLGKLVVLYGPYENAPFRWLVANDVGYMKYIIDKHRSENIQRASHLAIEELKGHAGLDENGVSLFKTPEAIEMWAAQQQHLECIQDPPDLNMYRVAHTTTFNNVDVPYYKCLHGNSLEGFHKALPNMNPGPHCAAQPYQVYLISGIARTLSMVDPVQRRWFVLSSPIRVKLTTATWRHMAMHWMLTCFTSCSLVTTSTVHSPAFEDACSPNPLPGFQKLEMFCSLLVKVGLTEDKLSLTTEQRNRVLKAWNAVEEHDKQAVF